MDGNDDNAKSGTGMTGGTVPAKIWKDVMSVATAPYGATKFEYPEVELNFTKLPPKVKLNPTEYLDKKDAETQKTEETSPENGSWKKHSYQRCFWERICKNRNR